MSKRMSPKRINQLTGTAALPDLWHYGEGGTLGRNLNASIFDIVEAARQLDSMASADNCRECGKPTQGLTCCDDCLDAKGGA